MDNFTWTQESKNANKLLRGYTDPDWKPNGLTPADCGEWSDWVALVEQARKEGGPEQAKTVLAQLSHESPAIMRLVSQDPDLKPQAFRVWTADEILTTDFPEPTWAINELLPVGLSFLAGKAKVGKSWLALQLAQAVATGGHALGYEVIRGAALYLALEDPPRRLKERMKAQGWPLGTSADFLTLGDYADQIGDLSGEGVDKLTAKIQQSGYRLVVIDTLSRAIFGDQNDTEVMTRALTPLQEMAHANNVAILLIDHHKKTTLTDADAITDILGSTAKGAMLDTAWGLYRERGKPGAKLQIIGRDVAERTLALHFDALTSAWQCDGDAERLAITEQRQEILDTIAELGPCGVVEIANALDKPKPNIFNQLQDLTAARLIVREREGRNVFYRVL